MEVKMKMDRQLRGFREQTNKSDVVVLLRKTSNYFMI